MLIPLMILLIGVALIAAGSMATGMILAGIGILAINVGGPGSLGFGTLKVTGPAGLIMIALGFIMTTG